MRERSHMENRSWEAIWRRGWRRKMERTDGGELRQIKEGEIREWRWRMERTDGGEQRQIKEGEMRKKPDGGQARWRREMENNRIVIWYWKPSTKAKQCEKWRKVSQNRLIMSYFKKISKLNYNFWYILQIEIWFTVHDTHHIWRVLKKLNEAKGQETRKADFLAINKSYNQDIHVFQSTKV